MRSMSLIKVTGVSALVGLLAATVAPVMAEGPVLGGYIQGSYQYNLNKPRTSAGVATGNQVRVFDQAQDDDFSLNAVQLKLSKPVAEENYGYGLKLLFGEDARVLNGNGTYATANDQVYLQEAYGTYAPSMLKGLSVTGGRFVTLEGVEIIESPLNLNITEGILFGYAMPFTHTGLKANYVVNDMINVTAGIVNGWDNSNTFLDNNRGKSIIWQVATTPLKGLTSNLQGTYGPEASNTTNANKRTSLDYVISYTGVEKLTVSAEANWGQDKQKNVGTNVWKGVGVWAGYAFSDYINPSVRFESFDDTNGSGRGLGTSVQNVTLTNKFQVAKNKFMRIEYRHDWASSPAFQNKIGNTVRVQNTIAADCAVLF